MPRDFVPATERPWVPSRPVPHRKESRLMGDLFGSRIIPEAQPQRCSTAIPSLAEQTRARMPGSAPSAQRFPFFSGGCRLLSPGACFLDFFADKFGLRDASDSRDPGTREARSILAANTRDGTATYSRIGSIILTLSF